MHFCLTNLNTMMIQQFEDKYLAHYSYAILDEVVKQIVLIDPARNPKQYFEFAKQHDAKIIGVIETHPHADFVSSHLEIHKENGATIYNHSLTGVSYPFTPFDDGAHLSFGDLKLKSLHTPGHSPDSISIVLKHKGKNIAVFTGDTLFIGDCGRPDLRESAGNLNAKREELAGQMFHSLRDKLLTLDNDVLVYPAHGAGTLCGKALSEANSSTIGAERISNWSLQEMKKETFIKELTTDQPFIPKYFGYNVDLNRNGAPNFEESIKEVQITKQPDFLNKDIVIIDARPQEQFKQEHLSNSYNIQTGAKFETWLGSIINPKEKFYLTALNATQLQDLVERTASIGYEGYIEAAFVFDNGTEKMSLVDVELFKDQVSAYNIIDIRNKSEFKNEPIFPNAKNIPLGELRERINEIPTDKPVIIHCAGGYRSAAGSSIVNEALKSQTQVYDLSEAINQFYEH